MKGSLRLRIVLALTMVLPCGDLLAQGAFVRVLQRSGAIRMRQLPVDQFTDLTRRLRLDRNALPDLPPGVEYITLGDRTGTRFHYRRPDGANYFEPLERMEAEMRFRLTERLLDEWDLERPTSLLVPRSEREAVSYRLRALTGEGWNEFRPRTLRFKRDPRELLEYAASDASAGGHFRPVSGAELSAHARRKGARLGRASRARTKADVDRAIALESQILTAENTEIYSALPRGGPGFRVRDALEVMEMDPAQDAVWEDIWRDLNELQKRSEVPPFKLKASRADVVGSSHDESKNAILLIGHMERGRIYLPPRSEVERAFVTPAEIRAANRADALDRLLIMLVCRACAANTPGGSFAEAYLGAGRAEAVVGPEQVFDARELAEILHDIFVSELTPLELRNRYSAWRLYVVERRVSREGPDD